MMLRRLFVLVLAALCVVTCSSAALAGTVGVISGKVTDAASGAPIAGVGVTATSPTGHLHSTTDARGFYVLTGLSPDTYTVTFTASGYNSGIEQGVGVFADQVTDLNVSLVKAIKVIGVVQSRSASSAFQPNHPNDTYNINSTDIADVQGLETNQSATQLFASLPSVSNAGLYGVPIVRGGRANDLDYEIEGIPVNDPYNGTFGLRNTQDNYYNFDVSDNVPTLALQELQLTPGSSDASFANTGTGDINMVVKRGRYPGFLDAQMAIGGGGYAHAVSFDYGTASADGRWDAYVMFHGDDVYPNWGDGHPPSQVGTYLWPGLSISRTLAAKFDYNWGPSNNHSVELFEYNEYSALNNDYGVDSRQFCFYTCSAANAGANQPPFFGPYYGICNFMGTDFPASGSPPPDPLSPGTFLTPNCWQMLPLFPGQANANETLGQAGLAVRSANHVPYAYKVQYTDQITPAYTMQLNVYRSGGYQTDDQTGGYNPLITQLQYGQANPYWFRQGGYLEGTRVDFTRQLSDQHLLKFGGEYRFSNPSNDLDFPIFGQEIVTQDFPEEAFDFIPPQLEGPNGCVNDWWIGPAFDGITPDTNWCGYLYQHVHGQSVIQLPVNSVTTDLHPHYQSVYASDRWQPNTILTADFGLRIDHADYNFPAPVVDPATCTSPYFPLTWSPPTDSQGNYISIVPGKACPKETFANFGNAAHPTTLQPRVGLAFNLTPHDSLRIDFGRTMQYPIDGQMDPGTAPLNYEQGLAGVQPFFSPIWYCLYSLTGFNGEGLDPRCTSSAAFNSAYGPYQDAGFYNYFNPFPCKTPVVGNSCSSDPNWPYPPPGQPNPAGPPVCGFGFFPFQNVPCGTYQQQMRWEMMNDGHFSTSGGYINPIPPATFLNYDVGYMHEFANGIGHGWLREQTEGLGASVTFWDRVGHDLSTYTSEPIVVNGNVERNGSNNPIFYPQILSAAGKDLADGIEARITRSRPLGFSFQFSGTYQHVLNNCPTSNGQFNGLYSCTINGASIFLNNLYYPGYVTPLQTTTDVSYRWKGGWVARTQVFWFKGYPLGSGRFFSTFIDGFPYNIYNTNASNGGGQQQYIDPYDPGSLFNPNIAATSGTPNGQYVNGAWGPAFSITDVQLEKAFNPSFIVGLNVDNLFNQPYFGPVQNGAFQPVATGLGGPLSNYLQYGSATYVNQPYVNLPQGEGRTYSMYVSLKGI